MNADVQRARAALTRALENLFRYSPNTYGHLDAIRKEVPNAVEALVEAKMAAMRQAALAAKEDDDAV